MNEIKSLKPFTRFLMTIGELPSSYLVSMTYEEQLLWFCNYLEKTVIPTVNNNAEAVIELQNYIKNYFDNLDVQDEIDHKLDEMAESGQLTDIIAQYLQLAGILAFNTKADLKSATNIVEGSICKTLGNTTYNDGYGNFYKIRTITSGDVVDDDNILALTVSPTLIAEKIPNSPLADLNTTLQNEIDLINSDGVIMIGDSYLYGQGLSDRTTQNYGYLLKQKLGLNDNNCFIFSEPASGFVHEGTSGNTFLELLQASESAITNKNSIKKIIVCGGGNDTSGTISSILTAINNFVTYCKTNYPNAKVYIGLIGNNNNVTNGTRSLIKSVIFPAYKRCNEVNGIYLNGVEMVMQNYGDYYQDDHVHPNANGQKAIADAIYQALLGGSYISYSSEAAKQLTAGTGMTESTVYFNERIKDNRIFVLMNGGVTMSSNITSPIKFGAVQAKYIRNTQSVRKMVNARISDTSFSNVVNCPVSVYIDTDGLINISILVIPSISNPRILQFNNQEIYFDYDQV